LEHKIPYFSFEKINSDIQDELEKTFHSLIDSKWYILGKELENFEKSFAHYLQVKYAIGVGNGLDALRISLNSLNLDPGDEVILPGFTFIATLLAVIHSGAQPVLVDVNPETYVLDTDSLYPAITSRTRVIIPVHIFGNPCAMNEIMALANEKGIHVIEDYAQAVGGEVHGRKTGSFGRINAASFYPTKTLGAIGDGGIITTNSEELAESCRLLRNYGFRDKKHHQLIGYNSRLDELQAALLSKKIFFLDRWISERKRIALIYLENLRGIPDLQLPDYSKNKKPSYHIFPVMTEKRDALKRYLKDAGIETMIHYEIPPHLQESMKYLGYQKNSFPVTERISETEISLPIYPGLSETDTEYITVKIRNFMSSRNRL
jgi:dTDP-4-amino-4,6-dideoxygalactose transaminase